MHVVEALGFRFAHVNHAHGAHPESRLFDASEDLPAHLLLHRIWFDDGKRPFHIRSILSAVRFSPFAFFLLTYSKALAHNQERRADIDARRQSVIRPSASPAGFRPSALGT